MLVMMVLFRVEVLSFSRDVSVSVLILEFELVLGERRLRSVPVVSYFTWLKSWVLNSFRILHQVYQVFSLHILLVSAAYSLVFAKLNKIRPVSIILQSLSISNYEKIRFSSCNSHIHSPVVSKKAYWALVVRPYSWEDDYILFSALKSINSINLNEVCCILVEVFS